LLSLLGLMIVCDVPGGIVVLCNALIEISFEQNSEVIRRRTCITHTEKEQFGLKLTLKTQNLHRNFRERSSTSEGEHQFRPSHEQPTEVACTLRKSLRRCGESQIDSGPTTSSSPGSPVLHRIYIRRFPIQQTFLPGVERDRIQKTEYKSHSERHTRESSSLSEVSLLMSAPVELWNS
jgi:hypothetical protein